VLQLYAMLKPPLAAKAPLRVRAELAPMPGGAARRGNLPALEATAGE
jgi:hypothetical protein